ncbi:MULTISPECIES: FAD-dependent monooxygenase [Actinosynnema]|uniref:FAD-dependent monooxygenase n=1 Tax=Actinosynnema TaxID=40566 RepID=UPI0020A2CBF8|nr:FAD-dependent monooxygenase [Actinosynnema pretiosum]MCP2097551.1 4,5-epoxidase [Actinosynnema pretiosum]
MSEVERVPVLVVGAGPTGLALACGLRALGVEALVVDRAVAPATTSRALGVQPRGVEVLLRLGALGDLPGLVIPLREVRMHSDGRLVSVMPVERMAQATGRAPLLVSQVEVEASLRDRLAGLGGAPEWGVELVDCAQDGSGVTAVLRGGGGERRVRADWVVGCDGARSLVRELAGIGFPGEQVAEHFLIADVRADWAVDRGVMGSWTRGRDMISVCPLPGEDRWRLMGPAPAGTAGRLREDEVRELVLRQLVRCTPHPADAITRVEWLSSFRIHRRLAEAHRRGRLLLAGDAAAIHHPFGGQGMNTGLGDAENLAWKLALVARGRAGQALLDTYAAERRPVAEGVLAGTGVTTGLVSADHPLVALVRDRVVLPLMNTRLAQGYLWRRASQLGVGYRRGPLAAPGARWGSGPVPGDRMPDLACRDGGGVTALHAALRGRWAVLAPDGLGEATEEAVRGLLGADAVVGLVPVAGGLAEVLLVRPDGHLAWRGRPDPGAVSAWLRAALSLVEEGALR